jgi:membrane associated rhomboid family serine protease
MFPYKDENPTERPAVLTVSIIIANVLAFILLQGAGAQGPLVRSVCDLGLIPAEILHSVKPGSGVELAPGMYCLVDAAPQYWTVLTSMFMHGGWLHLIGNMVFLWVFGNNIEDVMGHARFAVFYLVCGVVAGLAHVLLSPGSGIPAVGASGAISGVMGAYILLYPQARVRTWVPPIFVWTLRAWVLLGYWFVLQVMGGLVSLGPQAGQEGGVAVWAHVGGFVAGLALVKVFENRELTARRLRALGAYRDEVARADW